VCQRCRGGVILYRTYVNASVAVAGAVLHLGGAVHDVAQVPQPCSLAQPITGFKILTRCKPSHHMLKFPAALRTRLAAPGRAAAPR